MNELSTFRTIYYNTIEMLVARNYDMKIYLKNKKSIEITDKELIERTKIIVSPNSITDKKVHIYFFTEKMGVNEIKVLFEELKNDKVTHFIFITKNKLTSYAVKEMKKYEKIMEIETFYNDDMMFNITKHVLVPKHELLTKEENKFFIEKMGKKIPYIKKNDKVCRYYNGKIDQIFRIYRKNEIYYRIVVL